MSMGNSALGNRQFNIQTAGFGFTTQSPIEHIKTHEGWEVRSRITQGNELGTVRTEMEQVGGLIPITTFTEGVRMCIDGKGSLDYPPIHMDQLWTFATSHRVHGDIQILENSFCNHPTVIMSDASVDNGMVTAGWIETTEESYKQEVTGIIQNNKSYSHRAKSYGILGGLSLWKIYRELQGYDIVLCCDNKSAISYACNTLRYPHITSKITEFDILMAIRTLLVDEKFKGKHVKGHQDRIWRKWIPMSIINCARDYSNGNKET
jgi:hypothetical protein